MEAAKKEVFRLHPSDMQGGDFARALHVARPPEGTPYEAVLAPEFWGMVASKIRIGDKIEVYEEGGAYYAELLVRNSSPFTVTELVFKELEAIENFEPVSLFRVSFHGPKKYRVTRLSDGYVVREGIQTKEEAYREAADQEKAMRR